MQRAFKYRQVSGQLMVVARNDQVSYADKLLIADKGDYTVVNVQNIVLLRAESNYCSLFLSDGRQYLLARTLKDLASSLNRPDFLRVHQSYLVNLNHLERIATGVKMRLLLAGGYEAHVSRSKRQQCMEYIKSWIKATT